MSSEQLLVFVRVRDAESIVEAALAAILSQQGVDFHVIVVDDASSDRTAAVVEAVRDSRIRLVRTASRIGTTRCRELALGLSNALFVAEVSPHGVVLPDALRKLLAACTASPAIGLAHCYYFDADEKGRVSRDAYRDRRERFEAMFGSGGDLGPLRVFRRGALEGFEIATVREHLFCRRTERTPLRRASVLKRAAAAVVRATHRSRGLYRRTLTRLNESAYYALVEHFASTATRFLPAPARVAVDSRRIAYYIWHFPVLSQTFVNRELAALKRSGVAFDVIADEAEDLALADHNAERVLEDAFYLLPVDDAALARYRRFFWRRTPLRCLRTLLFVLASRQTRQKQLGIDVRMFAKAMYLAGVLRERGISHIHAPWADNCAVVALVAARLAGISYSVQARAHEIHRREHSYGLRDRLEPAAFVVTNTDYNARHLRSLVAENRDRHIHVINNGVDLERFEPVARLVSESAPARVLCVARLIEQKGLVHLLQACKALLDRGVDLTCDIIGGSEEPLYTNYLLELRRVHCRLGLEARVRFQGARPLSDVLNAYREADLFVLPSVVAEDGARDITPNALIEAMAMGLPVVSTTVGGIPEIVEDGVSGVLVAPGDQAALAGAMEALIRDRPRASALGARARQRVEAKFDISKNVRRYTQLFSAGAVRPRAAAVPAPRTLASEPAD